MDDHRLWRLGGRDWTGPCRAGSQQAHLPTEGVSSVLWVPSAVDGDTRQDL